MPASVFKVNAFYVCVLFYELDGTPLPPHLLKSLKTSDHATPLTGSSGDSHLDWFYSCYGLNCLHNDIAHKAIILKILNIRYYALHYLSCVNYVQNLLISMI